MISDQMADLQFDLFKSRVIVVCMVNQLDVVVTVFSRVDRYSGTSI